MVVDNKNYLQKVYQIISFMISYSPIVIVQKINPIYSLNSFLTAFNAEPMT